LLNGTDGMLGMLVMACADLAALFTAADITAALTLEALLGTAKVLAPELHAIRAHPGQAADRELAAAIDNPVVLTDGAGGGRVESNGNFHGAPVAYVLDFLAI